MKRKLKKNQGTRKWMKEATPLVWTCATGLAFTLLMTAAMFILLLWQGLPYFWPLPIDRIRLTDGNEFYGEVQNKEGEDRLLINIGARDIYGQGFRWIHERDITKRDRPRNLVRVERMEWGPVFGEPLQVTRSGQILLQNAVPGQADFEFYFDQSRHSLEMLRNLQKKVDRINQRLARLDNKLGKLAKEQSGKKESLIRERKFLMQSFSTLNNELARVQKESRSLHLKINLGAGGQISVPMVDIIRLVTPNRMTTVSKLGLYFKRWWEFITTDPREANTEGGIFPAIFGTMAMVIIMSLFVVPLGVVAAIYLREYARQNWWTRFIRISVNNLAGVPSIVYGVFGLGFFIYFVGGHIDRWFFADTLPSPTFGTGGILWASMTLALLTVPVVIVATEESLLAIEPDIRHGARALGATQWQTVRNIIFPSALPGILTGIILAVARAAGEVAPIMLTGVVKLAPEPPVDMQPPFIHLERKFMHLGFHIYDVGFQSPNVEAAKPMVYNTTLILLAIVVFLNLTAMIIRYRVKRRFHASGV